MKYECGFFATNKKHCVINEHCVVCGVDVPFVINLRRVKGRVIQDVLRVKSPRLNP